MSSSDGENVRGFALALIGQMLLIGAAMLAVTWIVDPFGVLRPAFGGPGWCAPGVKSGDAALTKPLLATVSNPQTILLGTSRVQNGFDPVALAIFPDQPAVNLGVPDASIAEMAALAEMATARGTVRTIVLGIDTKSFVTPPDRMRLRRVDASLDRKWIALRYGLLDSTAVFAALRNGLRCNTPQFTEFGAPTSAAPSRKYTPSEFKQATGRTLTKYQIADGGNADVNADANLATFSHLVARLHRAGIRIVILTGPERPEWQSALDHSAYANLRLRIRLALQAMALHGDAELIDATAPDFATRSAIPACDEGKWPDCQFSDLTHYNHSMGRTFARIIANEAKQQLR